MPKFAIITRATQRPRSWIACTAALASAWVGCASIPKPTLTHDIDEVSRSSEAFLAFLQSPGTTIGEIRAHMPDARVDTVFLIAEDATNEELADYIQFEASEYPFEIFLRVTISTANRHVYRTIVKGDWRSVKMGYGSLHHPELYDAIYLHTHPRGKRVIPNSIADYIHAESYKIAETLLVGDGIAIEFESIEQSGDRVDHFLIDGRELSIERPEKKRARTREQARRDRRDANADVRELDRIFRENVAFGHERVALRNSEGMLITYERSRALAGRLDEVYRDAGLVEPNGGGAVAASGDAPGAAPSSKPLTLGY